MTVPRVSVIVPAYNAAPTLAICLEALHRQTLPRSAYEIIVVDDGSQDETVSIASCCETRVYSQPNAGPAAARNRGAELASTNILLFTDADCEPAPDWIEQMIAPFEDPTVVGVKGVYGGTRQPELVARFVQQEYADRYDRMPPYGSIDFVDTYAAGYRRDIFLQAGGFDTSFASASVEDQELSFRLASAGHRLVFVPRGRVFHIHDRTVGEYVRRKFWIGYWKVRVMRAFPDKLVRDSHTPQSLKLQIGLAGLGGLLLLGGLWKRRLALAGLLSWLLIPLSAFRFLGKLLSRDWPVILAGPLLLFLRAWALGMGFAAGLWQEAIGGQK